MYWRLVMGISIIWFLRRQLKWQTLPTIQCLGWAHMKLGVTSVLRIINLPQPLIIIHECIFAFVKTSVDQKNSTQLYIWFETEEEGLCLISLANSCMVKKVTIFRVREKLKRSAWQASMWISILQDIVRQHKMQQRQFWGQPRQKHGCQKILNSCAGRMNQIKQQGYKWLRSNGLKI